MILKVRNPFSKIFKRKKSCAHAHLCEKARRVVYEARHGHKDSLHRAIDELSRSL